MDLFMCHTHPQALHGWDHTYTVKLFDHDVKKVNGRIHSASGPAVIKDEFEQWFCQGLMVAEADMKKGHLALVDVDALSQMRWDFPANWHDTALGVQRAAIKHYHATAENVLMRPPMWQTLSRPTHAQLALYGLNP